MTNVFGQIVSKILKCFRHVSVVNRDLLFVAKHHVQKHSIYDEIGTVYCNIYFTYPSQSYFKLLFNEITGLVVFLNSNLALKKVS